MPQAIMDPEQVRRFAEELLRFNRDLQGRLSSLHTRFTALSESWQDQEQAKFSEEFIQAMNTLKRFVDISEQHVPYLLRKAQRVEDYLRQK
ncbi:MAG TPA: WXG100 family type VII secretion target [Verrucomicrobiae bacterium]|nr:WXG100 family type VII secretion target [Verrucomicrobiae bacterium]